MNNLLPPSEPTRVTLRRIAPGPYIKWYTLALIISGSSVAGMCTAWYALNGQLRGKVVSYFLVMVLYYAVPGLIGSILFALIYNSLAGKFGGLQFDIVVEKETLFPSPPPPERREVSLPKIPEA